MLQRIRATHIDTPVIIPTAPSSIDDTVDGLRGDDGDGMAKPVRFEEPLARVRLCLCPQANATDTRVPCNGGPELDPRSRRVHLNGREIDLSARKFSLAEVLMRNPGRVLGHEQPLSHVVDVHERHLLHLRGAAWFMTVRGMGY